MRIELSRPRRRLITLTPLIDVVFILLVFFMLASNFLDWRVIELDLAKSTQGTSPRVNRPWVIRVEHNGRVALNDQQLNLQRLKERVRALLQSNPEQSFIIQPASNSVAQATVDVLDQLSAAGATRISLAR